MNYIERMAEIRAHTRIRRIVGGLRIPMTLAFQLAFCAPFVPLTHWGCSGCGCCGARGKL